ncbi:hypothetical protein [Ideonella sp.]|uniref:hypothetical protein n=1 Tax=Ideonella sp. TaxID=1929293 RepID=UPI003BB710E4
MNRIAQLLVAPLLLTTLAASAAAPAANIAPALRLQGLNGESAIQALGDQLPAIAARNRRSPEELRAMLRRDHTLRLDAQGMLMFVDELPAPLTARPVAASTAPSIAGATVDAFTLHSRPSAKRTIYLDFNGASLTGTGWNSGSETITAQPFDLDGDSASFSADEHARITAIWKRVAEDFAAFDVDVTTEQPAAERLTRSNAADEEYGNTVLITNNAVYPCVCGGIAYVGVYNLDDPFYDRYKIALVFFDMLAWDEKYIAEAISHEAGHNVGLNHDGTTTGSAYYEGQGDWAPIMGVGYYKPLVQWSKGEYANANNTEDDFAVMQNYGLPLRADDHGNTFSTATVLTRLVKNGAVQLSAAGVISQPTDKDIYSFKAGPGAAKFNVQPDPTSANLNLKISVKDGAGNIVAQTSPADKLSAYVQFTLPAKGQYYLIVTGVGQGDPLVDGYTSYSSLGQYSITGTAPKP